MQKPGCPASTLMSKGAAREIVQFSRNQGSVWIVVRARSGKYV
jgi:hypothetical protein